MKTKAQVIKENTELKSIINAVISNVSLGSVEDINNHGIDGGYSGFIYYSDTHQFAMKHRKTIVSMLENDANEFGQEITEMVAGFGVFRNSAMDHEDKRELYKYIGGGKCEQSTITNLMAWYAAEKVCRFFED
jgi:hypothetical protein